MRWGGQKRERQAVCEPHTYTPPPPPTSCSLSFAPPSISFSISRSPSLHYRMMRHVTPPVSLSHTHTPPPSPTSCLSLLRTSLHLFLYLPVSFPTLQNGAARRPSLIRLTPSCLSLFCQPISLSLYSGSNNTRYFIVDKGGGRERETDAKNSNNIVFSSKTISNPELLLVTYKIDIFRQF